jgi:hypothetical protein
MRNFAEVINIGLRELGKGHLTMKCYHQRYLEKEEVFSILREKLFYFLMEMIGLAKQRIKLMMVVGGREKKGNYENKPQQIKLSMNKSQIRIKQKL